jgi:hypothetical protein
LTEKWIGPFKVLKKVEYLYRLQLLFKSFIYNVFILKLLSKDSTNLLFKQKAPKPTSKVIVKVEEWEVKEILVIKLIKNIIKY